MKLTVRHLFRGKGAHRAPAAPPAREYIRVPLADLMGPDWPEPSRPYGAIATQAIRPCRPCGGDVPVVLHPGAHCCDRGHVTVTATRGVAS